jgi:multidrug resistance protein
MTKRSPLIPIFIIVAVDVLGFTLVLPLLPFYAEHYGASPLVVGMLIASFAICQFIAGPILGRLSDNIGRKRVLMLSQVGTFIGFIVLGLANSLWLIFLARIIDGITAGNLSIAQAHISDVTEPEDRTKAFGLIGIAFGMGFLIGPAISGFLSKYGYHWPAYAAAALSAASIVCTWLLLHDTKPNPHDAPKPGRFEQVQRFFQLPATRRSLIEFFLFTLAFSTLIGGLALYLERQLGFDAEKTGYVYAFSGLVGGLIQGALIGRLAKKFGEVRLAAIGFISMAIGYGLLGAVNGIPFLLILVVLSSFGSSVVRPSLTTLITHTVNRNEQGAALGVSQSLASVAQIIGPLIAGWLIGHGQLTAYGATAGAFSILGAFFLFGKRPDAAEPVPANAEKLEGSAPEENVREGLAGSSS